LRTLPVSAPASRMPDTETSETTPAPAYHSDSPSARTDAEREAHHEAIWNRLEPYRAEVAANGGTPLTKDESWALYQRRYTQPEPPKELSIPNIRRSA
jgi:hypothetical protein